MRKLISAALLVIGAVYIIATIHAFSLGGFTQVYMTVANEPSSLSFDTHILINRVLYSFLSLGLLLTSILFLRRPRPAAFLLVPLIVLLYLDSGGSFFDVLSSTFKIAQKQPYFDRIYNDLGITTILWVLSLCFAIAGVVFGFASKRNLQDG